MSVTNEEVSNVGPNGINGGGGGISPTTTTPLASSNNGSSGNTSSTTASAFADDVVKGAYLRKLKGKKKFFVLRKETETDNPARLEYYANEKKFRMGHPPKKSINLRTCFNISGLESKCKYSISLHTHNDCVRIAMNTEEEMNDWLKAMNSLVDEEESDNPVEGKLHFEHIWMVTALNKGLGSKENIIGQYRLCLTSKELTLLKVGEHDGRKPSFKFPLNVIRNVSHDATFGCFFHIELGRLASTGPGQLSLKTDDQNLAQNMHLVILKAMQNYSKEDVIPRESRGRTYTWNNESSTPMRSFHSTPPGMSRINSMDGGLRIRTDSTSSSAGRGCGRSPPMQILSATPSISFNSPKCSTTDSASSSYSVDFDNNNHNNLLHPELYSKSNEETESYVPWSPGDEQQPSLNSLSSLTLQLNADLGDYVDTSIISKDSSSSTAQTPSSYMEMQSPLSPFDNYIPMSPASAVNPLPNGRSNGRVSVSHSRNSSLVDENEGYVPMIPGGQHSRSESGAGSVAGSGVGFDEPYLDMDFTRRMNLSNDDMRRVSPASSESLQSNTPSSEFPLEKVSSYLTDDFDDSTLSMRPLRAYSVGSRSDTSSVTKSRSSKNRLEAVQETFRIRAMSVGSKTPRKTSINPAPSSAYSGSTKSVGVAPLSSSWSGSTGRWPMSKFASNNYPYSHQNYPQANVHAASESADSDLMELDFSKNKTKGRKRSLPGPVGSFMSTPSPANSMNITKVSPAARGVIINNITEVSSSPETSEPSCQFKTSNLEGAANRNYVSSAPISIQRGNRSLDPAVGYHDGSSQSILTRLTGTDLKKLKELDDEGAYLDMDFTPNKVKPLAPSNTSNRQDRTSFSSGSSMSSAKEEFLRGPTPSPVVVRPQETVKSQPSKFSLNLSPVPQVSLPSPSKGVLVVHEPKTPLIRSLSSSSNLSTISNNSNSSSASCGSGQSQFQLDPNLSNVSNPSKVNSTMTDLSNCLTALSGLTRIEESPEKQDHSKGSSGSITPQSPSKCSISKKDDKQVTYAAIEHLPPVGRSGGFSTGNVSSNSCGTSLTSTKGNIVTYAQIDFVKNAETVSNK